MYKVLTGLKIALCAIISIVVANLLQLDFSISAGIVAILTVAATKKETIKTVGERFIAFIIAIIISFICFKILGFTFIAFYLYLIIYLIICKYRNWGSAMALNSVLISHFLTSKVMNIQTISNEFLLFIIGALFGVLVNLHLKANDKNLKLLYDDINYQIKHILLRISQRISNPELEDYNGSCFININTTIKEAKNKIKENYMNSFSKSNKDFDYIDLIEQEIHILHNIYKNIININETLISTNSISNFITKLSDNYNDLINSNINEEFINLKEDIRKLVLPKNRVEFEHRAKLYIVLEYIEEFISLKDSNKEEL